MCTRRIKILESRQTKVGGEVISGRRAIHHFSAPSLWDVNRIAPPLRPSIPSSSFPSFHVSSSLLHGKYIFEYSLESRRSARHWGGEAVDPACSLSVKSLNPWKPQLRSVCLRSLRPEILGRYTHLYSYWEKPEAAWSPKALGTM